MVAEAGVTMVILRGRYQSINTVKGPTPAPVEEVETGHEVGGNPCVDIRSM